MSFRLGGRVLKKFIAITIFLSAITPACSTAPQQTRLDRLTFMVELSYYQGCLDALKISKGTSKACTTKMEAFIKEIGE